MVERPPGEWPTPEAVSDAYALLLRPAAARARSALIEASAWPSDGGEEHRRRKDACAMALVRARLRSDLVPWLLGQGDPLLSSQP